MADEIVVLNAGSPSLKLSVFVARRGEFEPDLRRETTHSDRSRWARGSLSPPARAELERHREQQHSKEDRVGPEQRSQDEKAR